MWRRVLGMLMLVCAASAWAGDEVLVSHAWLRESVPGQSTASLQLSLTTTRPGMLLKVETPLAQSVQIQQVMPRPGQVSVHVLRSLRLPRDRTITFGERGLALMLVGLRAPLSAGSSIPLTLTVRLFDGQLHKLQASAEVRALELSYRHYESGEVHDH